MIVVSVSGPGLQNLQKTVQYFRDAGGIRFDMLKEERGVVLGMLPGWGMTNEPVN